MADAGTIRKGDWIVVGLILMALVLGIVFAALKYNEQDPQLRGRFRTEKRIGVDSSITEGNGVIPVPESIAP